MSNGANRCTASQSHFSGLALTALVCGQFANDGPFNSVSVLRQLRVVELYLCSYIIMLILGKRLGQFVGYCVEAIGED